MKREIEFYIAMPINLSPITDNQVYRKSIIMDGLSNGSNSINLL